MAPRREWFLATALACAASGCNAFDRMDSECTPDAPSIEESEDCIRADAQGPQVGAQCLPIQDAPGRDPSWAEIEALLVEPARGGCTSSDSTCHGAPGGGTSGIVITGAGQELYDALADTTGTFGVPYLNPDDPESSWMHCNVRNRSFTGLVGVAMPQQSGGLMSDDDVLLVEDWILQGAKGPGN